MKGYPVIDGVLNADGVSFARFTDNQDCDYGSYAVGNNPLSPDAVHPMQMRATNKYNVDLDSLVFFYEPDPAWIVQEVCGMCIANNIMHDFVVLALCNINHEVSACYCNTLAKKAIIL